MKSVFFRSLIAFSLSLSSYALADIEAEQEFVEETWEEVAFDEEENEPVAETLELREEPASKSRRKAFPAKNTEPPAVEEQTTAEAQPQPKKIKPHFAGARRPVERPPTNRKPSTKVKNQWFSSKTHPKVEKKEEVVEADSAELPEDRPYYNKGYLASAHPNIPMKSQPYDEEAPQDVYPRTGFQAPRGHVFVVADWLYWRTRQEGMEFATSKEVQFEFDSGFRVGLGVHLPSFDGWCIYVDYTRFFPERSHSATGSFYPLFLFQGSPFPSSSGPAVAAAQAHWKIGFQSGDVEFGKTYYLSKLLVLSPYFGLKGAWIQQHAHIHYQGGYIPAGQSYQTQFKNDFRGAGPLLGTEIDWQLGCGFSFFGDVSAAALCGQFNNTQRQFQFSGAEVVHLDTDFNLVVPTLQLAAGIAWDRNFNHDKCHFGISAGFETQYWWNQNQTEQFTDDVLPAYVRQKGDLAFYGLTLGARVDF